MSEPTRASVPPPASPAASPVGSATALAPPGAAAATGGNGIVRLRELISGRATAVVASVEGEDRGAVAAHAERLLRQRLGSLDQSPDVAFVHARRLDDGAMVDGIANHLGVALQTSRVPVVAERIAERLRRPGTAVTVLLDEPARATGSWSELVLRDLLTALAMDQTPTARLVMVGPPSCPVLSTLGLPIVTIEGELAAPELWSWIDAVAVDVGRGLAGRGIAGKVPRLATLEARLDQVRDLVLQPLDSELRDAPVGQGLGSPWACVARAELALAEGDHDAAAQAMTRAEELADDPDARRDVSLRFVELLEPLQPEDRLLHAQKCVQRALEGVDADEAVRWARVAVRAGEAARVSDAIMAGLLESQGRALIAKGDVVMARAVLARARERGLAGQVDADLLAAIAVETGEAAYLAGDIASSESEARRALGQAGVSSAVRLRARNVLGKLLLARGLWDQADAHFAADTSEAARLGEHVAELRAMLNRAIALLWAERLDEAEGLFEQVREAGRIASLPHAQSLALENLAVIAERRRQYGLALERYLQAVSGLRRIGQASMLGTMAHNLGYLYLRLGDVTQAAAMARFAESLFKRGLAAPVVAQGDDLRARIAARVGRNEEALSALSHAREIRRASGDQVADCDVLEARLALDDGDVRGARLALDRASGVDPAPRAKAEYALVEAEWMRANGEGASEVLVAAREALALCRASGDEDIVVEAHLLVAEVARVIGDRELLIAHVEAAGAVRDAMLREVPDSHRSMFLGRPDMIRLVKLERLLESEPGPIGALVPAGALPESTMVRLRAPNTTHPRRIVGNDPALRALLSAVRRVAPSDTTVLIHGESGTGKELVAEALHFASDRAQGPMVKVNCAALVETLLLSELFGHEKGAFTGATARRRGRFELADGGTLFLDEIGDISPRTQVALLRVLQEKTFERVGGTTPIRVDVRVVCATHRDLATMVTRGEFREDLYYRLRGVQLVVPPLRARLSDLAELCRDLLERLAAEARPHGGTHGVARGITKEALDLLAAHKWPGNVRELENVLRAVALLADGPDITVQDLVEHVDVLRNLEPARLEARAEPIVPSSRGPVSMAPVSVPDEMDGDDEGGGALPASEASATAIAYGQIRSGAVSLFEMKRMIERDCIARALAETRGNITRAASLLGMKRPRLSQLVKHYGLSAMFTEGT